MSVCSSWGPDVSPFGACKRHLLGPFGRHVLPGAPAHQVAGPCHSVEPFGPVEEAVGRTCSAHLDELA